MLRSGPWWTSPRPNSATPTDSGEHKAANKAVEHYFATRVANKTLDRTPCRPHKDVWAVPAPVSAHPLELWNEDHLINHGAPGICLSPCNAVRYVVRTSGLTFGARANAMSCGVMGEGLGVSGDTDVSGRAASAILRNCS